MLVLFRQINSTRMLMRLRLKLLNQKTVSWVETKVVPSFEIHLGLKGLVFLSSKFRNYFLFLTPNNKMYIHNKELIVSKFQHTMTCTNHLSLNKQNGSKKQTTCKIKRFPFLNTIVTKLSLVEKGINNFRQEKKDYY